MNFDRMFGEVLQQGAASVFSELGKQLNPEQQQFNSKLMDREQELLNWEGTLRAAHTNFTSQALRHFQIIILVIESTREIPSLHSAFATALAERGFCILELERTAREAVAQYSKGE